MGFSYFRPQFCSQSRCYSDIHQSLGDAQFTREELHRNVVTYFIYTCVNESLFPPVRNTLFIQNSPTKSSCAAEIYHRFNHKLRRTGYYPHRMREVDRQYSRAMQHNVKLDVISAKLRFVNNPNSLTRAYTPVVLIYLYFEDQLPSSSAGTFFLVFGYIIYMVNLFKLGYCYTLINVYRYRSIRDSNLLGLRVMKEYYVGNVLLTLTKSAQQIAGAFAWIFALVRIGRDGYEPIASIIGFAACWALGCALAAVVEWLTCVYEKKQKANQH